MDYEEKDIVLEIRSDGEGQLIYTRTRMYTAFCKTENLQLYQGRSYAKALEKAEEHAEAKPKHLVQVVGF